MPQPIIFFDYDKITKQVIASGISKKDIYSYFETPYEKVFQDFLWIAQTLLFIAEKQIGISPARVFFNNSFTINAKAGKQNGLYLISINSGLVVQTSLFFSRYADIIEDPMMTFFDKVKGKLPHSIPTLLRDFSVRFTIDHEFAHLYQKRSVDKNWMEMEYSAEKSEEFSIENHVMEFDADFWGVTGVASAIHTYFEGIDDSLKNENTLSALAIIGVTSLLCKFYIGQKTPDRLYFKEHKHPHPLIRAMSICTHLNWILTDNLGQKFHLSWPDIMGNAIFLSDKLLEKNGLKFKGDILLTYVNNLKKIQEYINYLNEQTKQYGNLIINNPPTDKIDISWDKIFKTFNESFDNPDDGDILVGKGSHFAPI
ncbi:hypothetical protein D3H65_30400 [Paraflavitalea soli]|uniref:Peptidase U49 n=1 Tax=Paraflavitalea soli TaxID=2315862 RepID=A0A3B7MU21_9BACT|nr:hypothetical protein [Paraflavitalea soli]AXY78044.1 hypothetical protein D3H65_30400 [Paraflavitalea soli]